MDFVWACETGNLDMIKMFISKPEFSIHTDGGKCLRIASKNGFYEAVKYLIENGIDVHYNEDCAIKFACVFNHFEVVKLLVEHGADIHSGDDYCFRLSKARGGEQVHDFLIKSAIKQKLLSV